jgi:hypothetical protein
MPFLYYTTIVNRKHYNGCEFHVYTGEAAAPVKSSEEPDSAKSQAPETKEPEKPAESSEEQKSGKSQEPGTKEPVTKIPETKKPALSKLPKAGKK